MMVNAMWAVYTEDMSEQPASRSGETETALLKQGAESADQGFERAKTWYFATLASRINPVMELHKEQGLLDKSEDGQREWGNVPEHCLVEAARAREFAELFGFSEDLSEDLLLAAGVHDFFKRSEKDFSEKQELRWEGFSEATVHSNELMRQGGLSDRVVYLANAVGHETFLDTQKLLEQGELSDDELAYLIMHLIDDYTKGTDWVESGADPIEHRVKANEENLGYHALNEAGRQVFGGKTTFETQLELGRAVEQRLSQVIAERTHTTIEPAELPLAIDTKIRQRIKRLANPAGNAAETT